MYDGSAGFDLPDAIYLGHALAEADYLWYEEPMREFSISAYKQLGQAVKVPLNVAETSDGAHMNTADFIAAGCAAYVRTSWNLRWGVTGATRIAHLADAFLALPSGYGTLDEFFEILTWRQLHLHDKPIGLFNSAGFFDPLLAWIERAIAEDFVQPKNRELLVVGDDIDALLDRLLP